MVTGAAIGIVVALHVVGAAERGRTASPVSYEAARVHTPLSVTDTPSLVALLDRIEGLVHALKLSDAAAKVRATLGPLRDARETGASVADALERMQGQVEAMIEKDTLHLLHDAVIHARRLSEYSLSGAERMSESRSVADTTAPGPAGASCEQRLLQ